MSILAADFSQYVVIDALEILANAGAIPYSKTAHDLLMGTAAQESLLGEYLVQEDGSGAGVFMQTPDAIPALLARASPAFRAALAGVSQPAAAADQIITNLVYAAMIARLYYWLVPAPLPPDTVSGLWSYYKTWYNTAAGAATQTEWETNWRLTSIDLPS